MDILIGHTGFVGSNLVQQHKFAKVFSSKNIKESVGINPDLCVYAGVRAEKFLANQDPENDNKIIEIAIENIKSIKPKRIVLISTIDVYRSPREVSEKAEINTENLQPYGLNRRYLEKWVEENIEKHHIIRLPALFGQNLKKNFIYDLIHLIPSMLNEEKFKELSERDGKISNYYIKQANGFYKCHCFNEDDRSTLVEAFNNLGFSAVNFTDSRASLQFYNLDYLWDHIYIAIKNNIKLLNIAVEPIAVSDIYKAVMGGDFVNELTGDVPYYDFHTIYAHFFGREGKYLFSNQEVLSDIVKFVGENKR